MPDILWTTKFAVDCAPFQNVYAELGTTSASSVITFPTVCAHILGTLLKFMGTTASSSVPTRHGTGRPSGGSRRCGVPGPQALRKQYKYPELKEGTRRKILGLNSANLYGVKANGQL